MKLRLYSIKNLKIVNLLTLLIKLLFQQEVNHQGFYLFAEDDDVFDEGTEELLVAIDSAVSAKISSDNLISAEILDNDIRPTLKLERTQGSTVKEGDNSKFVVLEASIDSVTTVPLTVKLKTSGDTSRAQTTLYHWKS